MTPRNTPRIIAGTVVAAITITAGAAIASDAGATVEEPILNDVVFVRDVAPPEWSASDIIAPADDLIASPFDSITSVQSVESVDSP
ncbi:MAG: hypothetical protein M3112_01795, partial [Actinomycetia bacterium]|nr:hypothetical protein [Actinomycetes bacterium]